MISACDNAGILLQVNHNRRWSPEWNLGLRLLRDGAIGKLNHIYCYMDGGKPDPSWRSENEGPFLHDFTHYFDLMDMYAGEVAWLCGMAEQRMASLGRGGLRRGDDEIQERCDGSGPWRRVDILYGQCVRVARDGGRDPFSG